MNKTVQLVNEWATYEAKHPDASLEEFCRFFLTQQRSERSVGQPFAGGGIPPLPRSFLAKLLGFICRATEFYFTKAFASIPEVKQKEDFYFLNNIAHKGECRKTEVVHEQLLGLTTGIDTLNRLLANGLISERNDPTDKRAKLLQLTPAGEKVLKECYAISQKVNEGVFGELSDDEVLLCAQLLRNVEAKHSALVLQLKDKSIEEILEVLSAKT